MSRYRNTISCLIIVLTLSSSTWSSNDFVCKHPNISDNPTVEIGDSLMMCTFFLPYMIKLRFNLQVDKPEILHGKDLWKFFETRNVDMLAQVGNTRKFSQQIPFMRDSGKFAYPVMIFTIIVHKGIVIDIKSENLTTLCTNTTTEVKNLKLKSNISLPLAIKHKRTKGLYCHVRCDEENNGAIGKCDPKILITWKGTDKNNNLLLSHYDSLNTYNTYNKIQAFKVIRDLHDSESETTYTEENVPNDIKARLNKK